MNPSSAFVGKALARRELLGQREEGPVGEVVAVDEEELGTRAPGASSSSSSAPVSVFGDTVQLYRPPPCLRRSPRSAALRLAPRRGRGRRRTRPSSRRRRRRRSPIADVGAAVRDALRFPLAGAAARDARRAREAARRSWSSRPRCRSPARSATRARPRSSRPRRRARAARHPDRAPDDPRRGGPRAPAPAARRSRALVAPEFALRFHGRVEVHDAEAPDLVEIGDHAGDPAARQPRARRDGRRRRRDRGRDGAARRPGGAARPPAGAEALRAAGADSLLETRGVARLAARARARARARRARPADRRLAGPRPPALRRRARAATRTSRRRSSGSCARRCARAFRVLPGARARPRSCGRCRSS